MPSSDADGLEKVAEKKVFHQAIRNSVAEGLMWKSDAASETQRVLLGKTTMFSPKLLMDAGAPQLLPHQTCISVHLDATCSLLCEGIVRHMFMLPFVLSGSPHTWVHGQCFPMLLLQV